MERMEHGPVDCIMVNMLCLAPGSSPAPASPPGTAGAACTSVGVAGACTGRTWRLLCAWRCGFGVSEVEQGGGDAAPRGARGRFVSEMTVVRVCTERPEIERGGQGVLLVAFRGNLRRYSL